MSAPLEARAALAQRLAREAARRAPRALVRVAEHCSLRAQLDTGVALPRTASRAGILVTIRAEGPRGLGSADEWIGEHDEPARVVALALAAARSARDAGTLANALDRSPPRAPSDPAAFEPRLPELFRALVAGAKRQAGSKPAVFMDATVERSRTALAFSSRGEDGDERLHVRSRLLLRVEGELALGDAAGPIGLAHELDGEHDWPAVLRAAREAGRDAARRALARVETVPLGAPRTALLAPEVVTWILHGPLVEGFAVARAGAKAGVAPWLDVDDPGAAEPDEQGSFADRVPLVRGGVWQRGPFHVFDASGRTRRDPRSGVPRATLAALELRPTSEAPLEARAKLERRADALLGEVASADPLPAGGVFVVARAARRKKGGWRSAGLVGLRLDAGALFRRAVAVSRELEGVQAQELGVVAPWLLARGLELRAASPA